MQLNITTGTTTDGVVDRSFTLGDIPGVLWSPADAGPGMPLVLMGHGGGLHKRVDGLVSRARQLIRREGFHVAAIDAPGHGDRVRSDEDHAWVAALRRARELGEPLAPVVGPFNASLAERAVPEWQAVLDALLALPGFGPDTPVGYSGMTVAGAIGIPLAAADARIRAAVVGGVYAHESLLAAARAVTVPVQLLVPWDDTELDRASAFAVFEAFGSVDKLLLGFPGSHLRVPADRVDTGFFRRKLLPEPSGSAMS